MMRSLWVTGLGAAMGMTAPGAALAQQPQPDTAEIEERLDEIEERLDSVADQADAFRIGSTDFLITGYAFAGYTDAEGGVSSFDARFFPIFLWNLSDELSFAGELEIELEDSAGSSTGSSDKTKVVLEFMDISYIVNDHLTLRVGKILTPLSTFKEQLHPAWINRLPDQPLFATGGARLIPTSSLAFEARGSTYVGGMQLTYSAYVANGPKLVTTGGKTSQLNFSNFSDVNDNKAVGGRIGFFPMPELEIAYAVNVSDVGASGTAFSDTNAIIHDLAVAYVIERESIKGRLEARGELVFSDVDSVDFGAGSFDNERYGGYAQVAYRPTMTDGYFKNIEGVIRYDFLDNPSDATGSAIRWDEDRITLGANYWLNPTTVFKVAYRIDNVDDPANSKTEADAIMFQIAMGF